MKAGAAVFAAALLLALPPMAGAQDSTGHDSSIVRGIVIQRQGVFNEADEVGWLARAGNSLHVTTRPRVVQRELLFKVGEPFDSARVAETARNLRGLGIFRRVLVDSVRTDSGLVLQVTTMDGWSTRPQVEFSSTGGQTAFSLGLAELNLLGTAAYGAIGYSNNPDRSAVTALFAEPRLFASRIYFQAGVQARSDGRSITLGMGQRFLSLSAPSAVQIGAIDFRGDVLRFVGGDAVAASVLRRRYALFRADLARAVTASSNGFVRVGLFAQLRRDDFIPKTSASAEPFPRTVTAAIGPYVWINRAHFLVVHNFRSFFREEDVDLSPGLLIGTYAAPSAFGYERNGIGLQGTAQAGARTPGGFVTLRAAATGLYSSAGLDSGTVQLTGTWVTQPARLHTISLQMQAGWQDNPVPGDEFDLGLNRGPRAFYAHAFTGDRFVNFVGEYRWTAIEDLGESLGLGLTGFFDYGGAWYGGMPHRTGKDAGIGLRLGPSRTTDGAAIRIDLARRFQTDRQRAGWVLVVGSGARY